MMRVESKPHFKFVEEVIHVDWASRVSMDTIQKTLKQMDSSIKNLETDLKNASKAAISDEDKFLSVSQLSATFSSEWARKWRLSTTSWPITLSSIRKSTRWMNSSPMSKHSKILSM
jgi:hypothetical protein